MKTKPMSAIQKTGYHVVEEKLRATNAYLKTIDMRQLNETVEQVRKKEIELSKIN
jgi:hypothetical protein